MINITEPNCNIILKEIEIDYTLIKISFDIVHRSEFVFLKLENITVSYPFYDDKELLNACFLMDIADVHTDLLGITFTDNKVRENERIVKFIQSLLEQKFEVIGDYTVYLRLRRKRQTDRIV